MIVCLYRYPNVCLFKCGFDNLCLILSFFVLHPLLPFPYLRFSIEKNSR